MRFSFALLGLWSLTIVSACGQTIKLAGVTSALIKANNKNGASDDGVRSLTLMLKLSGKRKEVHDTLMLKPLSAMSKPVLLDSVIVIDRSQFRQKGNPDVPIVVKIKLSALTCLPKDEKFVIARKIKPTDSTIITIGKFNVPPEKPTITLKKDSSILDLSGDNQDSIKAIPLTLILSGARPPDDIPVQFTIPAYWHFATEPKIVNDVSMVIPKMAFDSMGCPVEKQIPLLAKLKALKNPDYERIPILLGGDEKNAHDLIIGEDPKATAAKSEKALVDSGFSYACNSRVFSVNIRVANSMANIDVTEVKTGQKASYRYKNIFHSGDFSAWFIDVFPASRHVDSYADCTICAEYLAERINEQLAINKDTVAGKKMSTVNESTASALTKKDTTSKSGDTTAKVKNENEATDVKANAGNIINNDPLTQTTVGTVHLKDSTIEIYGPSGVIKKVKIDSVSFTIEFGRIGRQYLLVETEFGRFFNGEAPISVMHINDRGTDRLMNLDRTQKTYVLLKDVIWYDRKKAYVPDNAENLTVSPKKPAYDLSAASNLNSLLNFAIFTDLPGLLGRRANGLINASASGKFITNTRNLRNVDIVPLCFVDASVTVSKFDSKFKSLDSSDIKANSSTHIDTVDRMQLEQTAWLKGSVRLNLGTWNMLSSQTLQLNAGMIFNVVNADSFYRQNHDIIYIDYYPELVYSVKRLSNFGMDLTLRWMFQFISDKEKFSNQKPKEIFNPQVAFYYYPTNNSNNQIYLRFNYFAGHAKSDNNFYQLQVGYKTSLKL